MSPPAADSTNLSRSALWRDVARALRGESHDYTREPLNRSMVLLAVPMVLEMMMQSLFAVVDVFWVSRLGGEAIAIVGFTESVMSLIYAVAAGLSTAASAVVARRIGENRQQDAAHAAAQSLTLGVGLSVIFGIMFGCFASHILEFMGASQEAIATGSRFLRWMSFGNATVFLMFLINAIFRGAGDAVLAMRTLWLANVLNMALCPILVFGWGPFPQLGLTGAAVATTLARAAGVLYQMWHLAGRGGRIRLHWWYFRPAPDVLSNLLLTSLNGIAQLVIGTASWIVLVKILATFGSTAVAAFTIAVRLISFALLPAFGLAGAAATLVGQNLGASRPDRAEAGVRIAAGVAIPALTIVGLASAVFADQIVRIFTVDPEVHAYAMRALIILGLAFPLYGSAICLAAAFNGAGDTWTPARTNFFCLWLIQLPLAWLLAHEFQLGPLGVFVAIPTALFVLASWSYVLFKQGSWKLKKV